MGEGIACVSPGLLSELMLLLERLMWVTKLIGVCARSPLVFRWVYHVWCIRVALEVLGVGSFFVFNGGGEEQGCSQGVYGCAECCFWSRFVSVGELS